MSTSKMEKTVGFPRGRPQSPCFSTVSVKACSRAARAETCFLKDARGRERTVRLCLQAAGRLREAPPAPRMTVSRDAPGACQRTLGRVLACRVLNFRFVNVLSAPIRC